MSRVSPNVMRYNKARRRSGADANGAHFRYAMPSDSRVKSMRNLSPVTATHGRERQRGKGRKRNTSRRRRAGSLAKGRREESYARARKRACPSSRDAARRRGPILAPPVAKGDANVVPETEILK